jgi:hypothetical protein
MWKSRRMRTASGLDANLRSRRSEARAEFVAELSQRCARAEPGRELHSPPRRRRSSSGPSHRSVASAMQLREQRARMTR